MHIRSRTGQAKRSGDLVHSQALSIAPASDGDKEHVPLKIDPRMLWIAIVALLAGGCSPTLAPANKAAARADQVKKHPVTKHPVTVDDALVQFSLVAMLAAGDYTGGTPLGKMLDCGDFGVGTFDRLAGEMIVLDGNVYQALADGTVRAADLDGTTPFAAVKFFGEDGRIENLSAASLDDLDEQLDRKLPHRNAPCAIRIDGDFSELTLRSVPAQSPPFRPLVEVAKQQVTWQQHNVRGTLIGLRCPEWIGTLNVAGYHWHFLSDDHKIGGHVLGCAFQDALLRFDQCTALVIELPQSSEFDDFDAGQIKKQDIDQIERQRSGGGRP